MSGEVQSGEPPLLADPQDPLPESNWLWRRLLTFGIVIFIAWQLHLAGTRIARVGGEHSQDVLLTLSKWLIVAWLISVLLYMIAPSAEQVAKMLATLSAWRSGISTAVTSRVATKQGTAETRTLAGPAMQPKADEPGIPDYAQP